jgi:transcriptional regulator with XRE-family HTH domain
MFIATLNSLIKEKKITKNKMLTDLGLGKNSFVNWETRGNTPDGETLIKLANYFDVSVDYLLGLPTKVNGISITPEERKLLELIKMLTEDEVKQASDYLGYIISKRGE